VKLDIANKWAIALQSGQYKQGYGLLIQRDKAGTVRYCATGVLASLAEKEGLTAEVRRYGETYFMDTINDVPLYATLSPAVREWAGMQSYTGMQPYTITSAEASVISMNDTGRRDFHEIAEYILANAEAL